MSSPGCVVAALSQNPILQQPACTEGFRPARQGSLRRLSMPSAALRVWNSPAQPSPRRPWENQPFHSIHPVLETTVQADQGLWGLHSGEFSGSASCSWTNAKSSVPQSDPSLGKSQVSQSQNKADAQSLWVLGPRDLLSPNCALHPISACQSHGFFSRWVFLAQGGRRVNVAPPRNG